MSSSGSRSDRAQDVVAKESRRGTCGWPGPMFLVRYPQSRAPALLALGPGYPRGRPLRRQSRFLNQMSARRPSGPTAAPARSTTPPTPPTPRRHGAHRRLPLDPHADRHAAQEPQAVGGRRRSCGAYPSPGGLAPGSTMAVLRRPHADGTRSTCGRCTAVDGSAASEQGRRGAAQAARRQAPRAASAATGRTDQGAGKHSNSGGYLAEHLPAAVFADLLVVHRPCRQQVEHRRPRPVDDLRQRLPAARNRTTPLTPGGQPTVGP